MLKEENHFANSSNNNAADTHSPTANQFAVIRFSLARRVPPFFATATKRETVAVANYGCFLAALKRKMDSGGAAGVYQNK